MSASPEPKPRPLQQCWWNVVVAFCALFAILGVPALMLPTMYGDIIDATGWSRGDVTFVSIIKYAVGALAAYCSGYLIDRLGIKVITYWCGVISGLAMAAMLLVDSLWMLYLVGAFLGVSALGLVVAMKVFVSQWFSKNQGFAVGIALMGISAAGFVVPFLTRYLSAEFGWQMAAFILSAPIWLIALPLFALKAVEAPKTEPELVLQHGATEPALSGGDSVKTRANTAHTDEFSKQPVFWLMVAVCCTVAIADHGMVQHVQLYIERDLDMGKLLATSTFTLAMIVSNFGKLGFGWVCDRLSVVGAMLCCATMTIALLLLFTLQNTFTLVVFAVFYGAANGGLIVFIPVLCKHCFKPADLPKTVAFMTAAFMCGGAVGPALLGYMHDMNGNYTAAFWLLIVACTLATMAMRWPKPVYWEEARLKEAQLARSR